MNHSKIILLVGLFWGLAAGLVEVSWGQEKAEEKLKPVRRARRPILDPQNWQGTYFENLFEQGLVGDPPDPNQIAREAAKTGNTIPSNTAMNREDPAPELNQQSDGEVTWDSLIPNDVLETEIKRLQIGLDTELTTPVKFQSDFKSVRDTFNLLSMWMAVIQQYSGEVRWKKDSGSAQRTFERTAANCRVASEQAFQNAVSTRELLRELVRGGSFPETPSEEDFAWSRAVDRNVIMRKLELAIGALKQNTGSKGTFEAGIEDVSHDAALIAAMGRILAEPDMDESSEEDYVKFAGMMQAAALEAFQGVKLNNYEAVSSAVNKIERSCNDCHADWR